MQKIVMRLIVLSITLAMISTLNSLLLIGESQPAESGESLLTYNDTAYGISIRYPSDWQIDQSAHEYLLAVLQNLTSEEMTNDSQSNAIKSQISDILNAFGLGGVSDIAGLTPDRREVFLQTLSQALSEGQAQVIVSFRSPSEGEVDPWLEGMNIVVENLSAVSSIPISLSDYVNANIEAINKASQNFKLEQPATEVTIDGRPAMTFAYTSTSPFDPSLTGKIMNVIVMKGNIGYVLTFSSNPEAYPTYLPTFEKMFQSLKISE